MSWLPPAGGGVKTNLVAAFAGVVAFPFLKDPSNAESPEYVALIVIEEAL